MYASVGEVSTLAIPAVWNQAILGLTPVTGRADSRFLAYWLRHFAPIARSQANAATQANLGAEQVENFPFPHLNVAQQRRIADFLDDRVSRIDRIIEARREQVNLLQELGKRLIRDLLLGPKMHLVGHSPWLVGHSDEVAPRSLRTAWSVIDCKHRTPNYVEDGYPVISPGDISPGRLDLGLATRFVGTNDYLDLADDARRCRPGDIVYSRNASAGIAAFVETNDPFTMGQDVCRITSPDQDQLYLAYCLNYLTAPQLDSYRVGSTFTRINVAQIKSLVVPMRDVATQARIATECDQVTSYVVNAVLELHRSIDLLSEYKTSLITVAVTGELDVTTAGSELPG